MYTPNAFKLEERSALLGFMRAHSFITLISVAEGQPVASHVPVAVVEENRQIVLRGHLAKANPHCAALEAGAGLAIFHGPHAYVSTLHYAAAENVPTWNYITVHAAGPVRRFHPPEEPAAAAEMLGAMFSAFEPGYAERWEDLPTRYREGMLRGIVGFELLVHSLEGKAKLSQNRSRGDQERVAAALAASSDPDAQATAAAMHAHLANGPAQG